MLIAYFVRHNDAGRLPNTSAGTTDIDVFHPRLSSENGLKVK